MKKHREFGMGGNSQGTFDDLDRDASNNSGDLPKKKITIEDMLHKDVQVIARDYRRRDKADMHKPQPYNGDLKDLKRFIRELKNVLALEAHKYKADITKI